ncbi:MAG: cytochrome c peroxidase [Bacteroidota bacterium]
MKKVTYFYGTLAIVIISLLLLSAAKPSQSSPSSALLRILKEQYIEDVGTFGESVAELAVQAEAFQHAPEKLDALQQQFQEVRNNFKRIEYLACFYDQEHINNHINGAPLPKLTPDDNRSVMEPKGLQRLEELIFDEGAHAESQQIVRLVDDLGLAVRQLLTIQLKHPIYHRYVFEAARYELVRIMALGVTGFEHPMTDRSIPESAIALQAVSDGMALYGPLLRDEYAPLADQLEAQFVHAVAFLEENEDFDSFDRLTFLRSHLNPLFATLLKVHKALGIPLPEEYYPSGQKFSIRYDSENIFDPQFINPFYFSEQVEHQYSEEVVKLGAYLFFDPILSHNLQQSCASCHQPSKSFTDGLAKSRANGVDGEVNRNAPSVINAAYSHRLFYDLRAGSLEQQVSHVVFEEKEFNTNFFEIFERLNQSEEYVQLFKEAFPQMEGDPIHKYTLTTALSSYVISLQSFQSPFDQYVRGESEELSPEAKAGFNLFMGKAACATCHFMPTFSGLVPPLYQEMESEILGVPTQHDTLHPVLDPDMGRMGGLTQENFEIYAHSFKTVGVRNVGETGPYMHNGGYQSLEEVMDFYNRGGGLGMGLDVPYQTLPGDPLHLDKSEQQSIIAFLHSLTDTKSKYLIPERLPAYPQESPYTRRVLGGSY